jgi:hypothetical protein
VNTYSENICVKDDIVFNDMCENPVYDMINPDWFLKIISNSFDKKVNLLLIIDVKSFPRQLMRVIAL